MKNLKLKFLAFSLYFILTQSLGLKKFQSKLRIETNKVEIQVYSSIYDFPYVGTGDFYLRKSGFEFKISDKKENEFFKNGVENVKKKNTRIFFYFNIIKEKWFRKVRLSFNKKL